MPATFRIRSPSTPHHSTNPMRTVPLRALCCSVIALCLGSCAVAQEPIAVLPSFTDSTDSLKATTDPNLEPPARPDFETDSDIEPAANVETALNVGRLEDIVRVALTANPAIAKARAKREALTGKRIQAGLGPNPKAGFFGEDIFEDGRGGCLLYTSPSPRDKRQSRMPSSA